MSANVEVFTIGHSTLSYERFGALLKDAAITAIADVRTAPYSRHFPHFNRDSLRHALLQDQIAYVFLGKELGGRPKESRFFCNGVADYEKMAETIEFSKGLERVIQGAKKFKIAMMCSEHDPLDCHRCLLVGRALHQDRNVTVHHIMSNGVILDQSNIEEKLLNLAGKNDRDFFEPAQKRLADAYRERALKVAFAEQVTNEKKSVAMG
jgi:uncharacterized protein (DUF488 family)